MIAGRCGYVGKTTDTGVTWSLIYPYTGLSSRASYEANYRFLYMIDDNNAFLVSCLVMTPKVCTLFSSTVFSSTDGGITWNLDQTGFGDI